MSDVTRLQPSLQSQLSARGNTQSRCRKKVKRPADVYVPSERPDEGLPDLRYPFRVRDQTIDNPFGTRL